MISKADKQATDWKSSVQQKKLAHGKLLCLFGSSLGCYIPKPELFVTQAATSHIASVPSKLGKSEIAAEREENKDADRLRETSGALCFPAKWHRCPAHGVRCQILSSMGHKSNPIQWQRGRLAATHFIYIGAFTSARS